MDRLVVWQVEETAGFESAWIAIDGGRVSADGSATGQLPEPYRLSYLLETDDRAATTRLTVTCHTAAGTHELELRRDGTGWTVNGVPRPDLSAALDCDLASSPVTNTMPVLRHDLHIRPGTHQFTMAFVEIPTLRVFPSIQTYTHLGPESTGGVRVRYTAGSFSSDLLFDPDGLVLTYPTMAHRIEAVRTG